MGSFRGLLACTIRASGWQESFASVTLLTAVTAVALLSALSTIAKRDLRLARVFLLLPLGGFIENRRESAAEATPRGHLSSSGPPFLMAESSSAEGFRGTRHSIRGRVA
jgi:hypothetical protein